MTEPEPGLRERKRRATRRRIQLAVLQLVDTHGLDQVTTDDISRQAEVSPRTFFNYFPTKEASLAGDVPFVLDDETAAAFIEAGPDGDPLGELLDIMTRQAAREGGGDQELHELRRRVMREYPQIFALRIDKMREFEAATTAMVTERLLVDTVKRGEEPDREADAERARVVALVAMAMARAAWATWMEHPDAASLPDLLGRSYGRLKEATALGSRAF